MVFWLALSVCVCDGCLLSCLMLLFGVADLKRCLLIVLMVAIYVIKFAHLCVFIGFFNLVVYLMRFCLLWLNADLGCLAID